MKHLLALTLGLLGTMAFAQTPTNIFPANGNAGISTTSPLTKFDIINPSTSLGNSQTNMAFFGYRTLSTSLGTGLLFQDITYEISPLLAARSQKIQSVQNSTKLASIEFNGSSTTNTTIGALTFSHGSTELMRINKDGKVRISSTDISTPGTYKLYVEDGILTEKVKVAVKTTANWADYVFADNYNLMSLEEVEKFTKENKHLPNVPSAQKMVEEGLDVATMDAKLLEKIEELTLYMIEQNKQFESYKAEQNKQIETLQAEVKSLKEKQK